VCETSYVSRLFSFLLKLLSFGSLSFATKMFQLVYNILDAGIHLSNGFLVFSLLL
jgi:hypothetical protein